MMKVSLKKNLTINDLADFMTNQSIKQAAGW